MTLQRATVVKLWRWAETKNWIGASLIITHRDCCWIVVKFWHQAEERRWTTIVFWQRTMKLFPSSTSASSWWAAGEMVRDCWSDLTKVFCFRWSKVEELWCSPWLVMTLLISAKTLMVLVMLVLWQWSNAGFPRKDLDLHQGGVSTAKCAEKVEEIKEEKSKQLNPIHTMQGLQLTETVGFKWMETTEDSSRLRWEVLILSLSITIIFIWFRCTHYIAHYPSHTSEKWEKSLRTSFSAK